ncbi:uncharacterized protein LOC143424854 [Xylocopa sonorina]|uniref:uncharacterized protein LOC143424854 n=1 Tax=Xylocopa sonorina TaxID=1818115 RepID=UPI00403AF08E
MILPKTGFITNLIVAREHQRLLHAGCQHTLASLRNKYWVISGRRAVKRVLHRCVTCFKSNPSNTEYKMDNLSSDRITQARAFTTCGVDYAGPFLIREGGRARTSRKAYVCLFVCFVTRAVHIELATDLTTDAFLRCLHRFMSRRGRCQVIHSDNGTNFLGARNQLREFGILLGSSEYKKRVAQALADEHIRWFEFPSSPSTFQ